MGNPRGVSRDFEALEARRMKAVALFREGLNNSEIGRQLQVANQTVSRWRKEYQEGGKKALRARCHNLDGFSVLEVYPGIRGCTGPNRHGARSLFSGCRAAGESIPFGCRLPPFMHLLREEETKLPTNTRALFLTHATVFAPSAYRISSLFEQLHRSFRIPTVLFYPGTWNICAAFTQH